MPVVLCIAAFNKYLTSKTVDKRLGLKCAGGELKKTEGKKVNLISLTVGNEMSITRAEDYCIQRKTKALSENSKERVLTLP